MLSVVPGFGTQSELIRSGNVPAEKDNVHCDPLPPADELERE
jgi:hypothetical protein